MAKEDVEYVKSHIGNDLEVNQKRLGRDYSLELGTVLLLYLSNPEDESRMAMAGIFGIGELEDRIAEELGKRPIFHQTKKCGLAVHQLWKDGDREGLEELEKYAENLILGGTRIR